MPRQLSGCPILLVDYLVSMPFIAYIHIGRLPKPDSHILIVGHPISEVIEDVARDSIATTYVVLPPPG